MTNPEIIEVVSLPLAKWAEFTRLKGNGDDVYVSLNCLERFWSKVNIGAADECWEWKNKRRHRPRFCIYGQCMVAARFAAYASSIEIPVGWDCCHTCDNPQCCNPAHLFAGTRATNMQDCVSKGRNYSPSLTGTNNPSSKLTDDDIRRIDKMRQYGIPTKQIATRFKVSPSLVRKINQRNVWGHISKEQIHVREVIE